MRLAILVMSGAMALSGCAVRMQGTEEHKPIAVGAAATKKVVGIGSAMTARQAQAICKDMLGVVSSGGCAMIGLRLVCLFAEQLVITVDRWHSHGSLGHRFGIICSGDQCRGYRSRVSITHGLTTAAAGAARYHLARADFRSRSHRMFPLFHQPERNLSCDDAAR